MKVAAYQFEGGNNYQNNLLHCQRAAEMAAAQGVKLLLLPEGTMFLRHSENDKIPAQTLDGEFVNFLLSLSKKHALTIVAGMFEPADFDKAYNTVVAVGNGKLLTYYRKLHLYDAFLTQESARIAPGNECPPVFECEGVLVGIMTCYDIRFPEQARYLATQGAELIVVPAAWFAGANKEHHWQLFCAVRALENGVYLLGADMCGERHIGKSCFVDSLGNIRVQLNRETDLLTAEVDLEQLRKTRETMPVLKQRRFTISNRLKKSS